MSLFGQDGRKEIEERQAESDKFRRAYSSPDAFDTLVEMALICKWRGSLDTPEDVAAHNMFEEFLARFGGNEDASAWSMKEIRAQLRAAIGYIERPDYSGEPKDVRR